MDFLDKMKNGLNKSVTTISVKTSSALEKTKLKTHMLKLEDEIKELKFKVGQTVYSKWESNEFLIDFIQQDLTLIQTKYQQIKELEEKMVLLEDNEREILGGKEETFIMFHCPNCNSIFDTKPKFCRNCGTKLE